MPGTRQMIYIRKKLCVYENLHKSLPLFNLKTLNLLFQY